MVKSRLAVLTIVATKGRPYDESSALEAFKSEHAVPFVIYAFALSTFALGLSEFIVIGLAPSMAASFRVTIPEVGTTVTAYALGVCVGGALLTGWLSSWTRRRRLLASLALFTMAHLAMAVSPTLWLVVLTRFASGLAHGLFLAVASSAAATAAGPAKGGRAVALVFSGLTVALVLGVPLGTFLGRLTGWRPLLLAIAVLAGAGWVALRSQLAHENAPAHSGPAFVPLRRALVSSPIVLTAAVTAATYAALFTVYTYIASLLKATVDMSGDEISAALLAFGGAAVIGNGTGGVLRDRLGAYRASLVVLAILILALLGTAAWTGHSWFAYAVVATLGFAAFAAVSVFQSRIIDVAGRVAADLAEVASGLNIAAFNLGIVLGSFTGGSVIAHAGIAWLAPLAGAWAVLALIPLILSKRKIRMLIP
ncbi:MFS transporter [Luteibacter sp. ME-Dv--P-043b]|uniref:MFS transporter n=1 Tax=Luteibacter sp. ME-Dv--P-043b TaxID=3040291 RepID=UPI0025524744|nr:MFS transporter [Luteibacter sp. ME-Dv--P-043b]